MGDRVVCYCDCGREFSRNWGWDDTTVDEKLNVLDTEHLALCVLCHIACVLEDRLGKIIRLMEDEDYLSEEREKRKSDGVCEESNSAFGVVYKSVRSYMRRLGIPTRCRSKLLWHYYRNVLGRPEDYGGPIEEYLAKHRQVLESAPFPPADVFRPGTKMRTEYEAWLASQKQEAGPTTDA